MMYGSILFNLWASLVSFTVYFFVTLQKPYLPLRILIGSFVAAIIGFFAMYGIRLLITYVLYTSNTDEAEVLENITENQQQSLTSAQQDTQQNEQSPVEFKDESTEEIAQVVRTMMHSDD